MEEMQGSTKGNKTAQELMVELHMIQHFQTLNSSLAVEEVVVVVDLLVVVELGSQVGLEVMAEQPFVYLPSIRLRFMAQS